MFISVLRKLSIWVSQILFSSKQIPEKTTKEETQDEGVGMDKEFYNQSSAVKLGWTPNWFGAQHFDEDLTEGIKEFQREHGLTPDGLCGPMTYRRAWTDRQANISDFKPQPRAGLVGQKYIVHNGKFLEIDWDKVILWDEPQGLDCDKGTYYDYSGKEDRKPMMFVNHWDVCLSAESCAKVLKRRGISVHFCIDNDGTIFQLLDTQQGAYQAGNTKCNRGSIGVEISNAYYTKYQSWYERNGFGPRPVVPKGEAKVHGGRGLDEHLDFYPVQVEALKALWKALHKGLGIPLEAPRHDNGDPKLEVDARCTRSEFEGFCHHYNITRRKIDCAGLDIWSLLDEVKAELD